MHASSHNSLSAPRFAVILPAAGSGKRFQSRSTMARDDQPQGPTKVEIEIAGKPLFMHTLEPLLRRSNVGSILLAVPPERLSHFQFVYQDQLNLMGVTLVPGGKKERWETIANALEQVDDSHTHVAVHDAARGLATRALWDRMLVEAEKYDAVIPAMPCSNTLKRVIEVERQSEPRDAIDAILGGPEVVKTKERCVGETVDRSELVEVQTPQVFALPLLRQAYQQIADGKVDTGKVTDDAGLVEALGQRVHLAEGQATNFKLTHPDDREVFEALLEKRQRESSKETAKKQLFLDDEDD